MPTTCLGSLYCNTKSKWVVEITNVKYFNKFRNENFLVILIFYLSEDSFQRAEKQSRLSGVAFGVLPIISSIFERKQLVVPFCLLKWKQTLRKWFTVKEKKFTFNGIFFSKVLIEGNKLNGMVCWFGFYGPLRQYFSLYLAVSQREGEGKKKWQTREKMSKQPPPAHIASAIGPCPTIIQCSGTPRHWMFTQHLRTNWLRRCYY